MKFDKSDTSALAVGTQWHTHVSDRRMSRKKRAHICSRYCSRETCHVQLALVCMRIAALFAVRRIRKQDLPLVSIAGGRAMLGNCGLRGICTSELHIAEAARLRKAAAWPTHVKQRAVRREARAYRRVVCIGREIGYV